MEDKLSSCYVSTVEDTVFTSVTSNPSWLLRPTSIGHLVVKENDLDVNFDSTTLAGHLLCELDKLLNLWETHQIQNQVIIFTSFRYYNYQK